MMFYCFFFFKQKTAYEVRISDWSSDVCSSDLRVPLHRFHFAQGGVAGDAGGIDQDVERAMRGLDLAHQRPAGGEIGDVERGEVDVEPVGFAAEGQIGRASGRERVCQSG